MSPRISIVLATYNGARYLSEQLNSLLQQTVVPHEIIIGDDNSQDGTLEIAQKYATKLPLKIYKNEVNLGFTKNFESALQKATGDFILPCDQDDIWESTKLETLLAAIGENSLVYADSLLVDENGNSLEKTL
ncbi:MAG: glycosyltransferase, partial [Thiovulaceae bacterium]|nr:glycosyltransferase [Sulfurimonadaceae bacterium]